MFTFSWVISIQTCDGGIFDYSMEENQQIKTLDDTQVNHLISEKMTNLNYIFCITILQIYSELKAQRNSKPLALYFTPISLGIPMLKPPKQSPFFNFFEDSLVRVNDIPEDMPTVTQISLDNNWFLDNLG